MVFGIIGENCSGKSTLAEMIDGAVARKTDTVSELGSKLDAIADIVFVAVCLLKLLPVLDVPVWLYIWTAVIAMIKLFNIAIGYIRQKEFTAVHSVMNKVTGGMLFLFPLTLTVINLKYSAVVVCAVATTAAIQEGYLRKGDYEIMRIYVDFDDCLCETGRAFSKLVLEMFNKHVPYDQILYFELDRSFDLDTEQYERLMLRAHEPEILLSFDATPGAAETINEWISCGHEVSIITGRPSSAYESSRIWLDEHGLKNARLYCLNKYGRDHFIKNSDSTLELEDYYRMKFDYAVEDSPKAFRFFEHLPELKVLVFDRPWNRECAFPNGNYQRCADWESIRKTVTSEDNECR